jgi:hypothetical protein
MNGTSGFHEVRASTPRSSTNRLLHEQRPQLGTGSWHLLRTHDFIAPSTDINTKREKLLTLFSNSRHSRNRNLRRHGEIENSSC